MGWWKTTRGGESIIGDMPLDVLGEAVDMIIGQYEAAHGRRPTKAEWAALFTSVLAAPAPGQHPAQDGPIVSVRVD